MPGTSKSRKVVLPAKPAPPMQLGEQQREHAIRLPARMGRARRAGGAGAAAGTLKMAASNLYVHGYVPRLALQRAGAPGVSAHACAEEGCGCVKALAE